LIETTVLYAGREIRAYMNIVANTRALPHTLPSEEGAKTMSSYIKTVLALLGIVTLVTRYKGQGNRLVQVIRRDGGLHYLLLIGWSC
jgi:hypothetical protein